MRPASSSRPSRRSGKMASPSTTNSICAACSIPPRRPVPRHGHGGSISRCSPRAGTGPREPDWPRPFVHCSAQTSPLSGVGAMKRTAMLVSLFSLAVAHAGAADLRVGLSAETTSLYPNWFVTTGNQQIPSHIFDNLVEMDANSIPQPGLAESWSPVDDRTWEFRLRHGVKFHDGTPFTADQVIATFDHSKTIEGVGAAAGAYLRGKTYTKVDDYTVRIATAQPAPLLPNEMTVLYIYPRAAPLEQFNTGEAAIGTGPYRLREWVKGSQIVLERDPSYWGKTPDWERVTFRPIGAGPTRIAALRNN